MVDVRSSGDLYLADVTVKKLASTVGVSVERLLAQLCEAGIAASSAEDTLTEADKLTLLGWLRRSHGKHTEPSQPEAHCKETVPVKVPRKAKDPDVVVQPEIVREPSHKSLAAKHGLQAAEAAELQRLLTDMRQLQFADSGQLSQYIVRHRLGYKYPNISGIVRMREADTEWDFPGGFPPNIYRIICQELGLGDRGTSAIPVGFKSFKASEIQDERVENPDEALPF